MNYQKIYNELIERAIVRVPDGYIERHHIIPRCLGGSDEQSNLVALYPEEHFLAHVLLVKLYPKERNLIYAVNKMCRPIKTGRRKRKLYGWLGRAFVARISEHMKQMTGIKNSQYGSYWVHNGTLNIKIKKDGDIPSGFRLGRTIKAKRLCACGNETLTRLSKYCSPTCKPKPRGTKGFRYSHTDEEILNALTNNNLNIDCALESLGLKFGQSGNTRNKFKRVLNSLHVSQRSSAS